MLQNEGFIVGLRGYIIIEETVKIRVKRGSWKIGERSLNSLSWALDKAHWQPLTTSCHSGSPVRNGRAAHEEMLPLPQVVSPTQIVQKASIQKEELDRMKGNEDKQEWASTSSSVSHHFQHIGYIWGFCLFSTLHKYPNNFSFEQLHLEPFREGDSQKLFSSKVKWTQYKTP